MSCSLTSIIWFALPSAIFWGQIWKIRDGSGYPNWWIFGRIQSDLLPPLPIFGKSYYCIFFPENPSLKHYINSHLPETNIEENTSMILPERLWVSISWMKESQTIYILSHIAQEKNLTRKDVLRLLMWGIRSSTQIWHNRWLGQATLILTQQFWREKSFRQH